MNRFKLRWEKTAVPAKIAIMSVLIWLVSKNRQGLKARRQNHFWRIAGLFFLLIVLTVGCTNSRANAKKGWIYVFSEPSIKAAIKLDGKDTGKTTNAILKGVRPGPHTLELTKTNQARPDLPFIGRAKINLKPGQKFRVIVQLNVMAIQPRKGNPKTIIAETEGQKAILDFYQAINNKDYATAYGLLSPDQKKEYSYSYKIFLRFWQRVAKVTVNGLSVKQVADQASMREIDTIGLDIVYNPVQLPKSLMSNMPPGAVQTDPAQPAKQQWDITTVGNTKNPGDIWRIDEIVKAE